MHRAKALVRSHAFGPRVEARKPPVTAEIRLADRPSQANGGRNHHDTSHPGPQWTRVRELAIRQLDRFVSLEPKVLRGNDPKAIHDMRVASRRLQQVLDLLHSEPPPKEIRRLRRKIRRARRALSEVRNFDVQIERVSKLLGRKRTSRRATWEAVGEYLSERRASTFEEALHRLSRLNLANLYVRVKSYLATNGPVPPSEHAGNGGDSTPPQDAVGRQVEMHLTQSVSELWQAYEAQVAESRLDPNNPALHGVRIATKRVRYLAEVLHELDIAGSAEALDWLRQLQQHLGDWHDLEVLEQMLIEMVARPKFLRQKLEVAISIEKVIQANRAAKRKYVEGYFQMLVKSADNQRLGEWAESFRAGNFDAENSHEENGASSGLR